MVIMVDEAPSFGSQIGRSIGQGLGSAGAALAGSAMQRREDKVLKEKYGIDTEGTRGQTRRSIIDEGIKRGMMLKQGKASIPREFQPGTTEPGNKNLQRTENGTQAEQLNDFSSSGQRKSARSTFEMKKEAALRTQYKLENGLPTDFEKELNEVRQENADLLRDQQTQQIYGQRAEESLLKVLPNATDEHKAYIKRKAEELSTQNLDQSEIDKQLAKESKRFAALLRSVERVPAPNRLMTKAKQGFLGERRNEKIPNREARLKVQPLLDEGLYDTARNLLSKAGYHPEERENIVSSLGETANRTLKEMPKIRHFFLRMILFLKV